MTAKSSIAAPLQALAENLSDEQIRDINRILEEGLFFYERDQPVLFARLRENEEAFVDFWAATTGLRLVVTPHMAYRRLPTDQTDASVGFLNPRIKPYQRDLLNWSGPGMSLRTTVFLMFLKFAEEELMKRQPDPEGDREFRYDEFYGYVREQFRVASSAGGWKNPVEEDGEEAGRSRRLQSAVKDVFERLIHLRFIELEGKEAMTDQDRVRLGVDMEFMELYRALPGLYTYESRALDQSLLDRTFGRGGSAEGEDEKRETEEGAPEEGPAGSAERPQGGAGGPEG